jgi:hypothetical protein
MFRQTPSGPTFTQTPLPCEPEDDPEPEPDGAGAVAGAVLASADAGAGPPAFAARGQGGRAPDEPRPGWVSGRGSE